MIKAEWKLENLFKADAQKVADEISSLESRTPRTLLEYAKNPDTELHKDSTGKNGTDFKRSVNIEGDKSVSICPVDFSTVRIEHNIVPTRSDGGGSTVLSSCNVFGNWRTRIKISCPKIVFPLETLIQIINTTGKYIGIGTQRGNGFGRYHIENATVIKK